VSELLSLADAERFLQERYGSRAGAVTPLGAGDWSRVFAVTLDGREMAVKFGAYKDDFAKDALMAVHSSRSLPIPAVHDGGPLPAGHDGGALAGGALAGGALTGGALAGGALAGGALTGGALAGGALTGGALAGGALAGGHDGGALAGGALAGGWFAVSQRARGNFLDQLDEAGMRAVLPALLAALRTARSIQVPGPDGQIPAGSSPLGSSPEGSSPEGHGTGGIGTGGYGLWRPDGTAPHRSWRAALLDVASDRPGSRTHGWRHALAGSPTGARPFDYAVGALRELAPSGPQPRQLIHSDLLYRNVLVQGPAITAVLDWGNSMYGDSLYDLAWLLYWWPWFPAWREIDIRAAIRDHLAAAGEWRDDADARLRCYQIHIGLDSQAYSAFTGRWQDLAGNARQTTALAEQA
jgi:hygromycin-B 4-O-kinase